MAKLTLKRRRFVDAFFGTANGNATEAAIAAGYSRHTARKQGSRLLTFVDVKAAVAKRVQKAEEKGIANAEERDLRLSQILRMTDAELGHVIAAIRELNKCSGRHSIKHVLDVTEKLADIIAASRAPA